MTLGHAQPSGEVIEKLAHSVYFEYRQPITAWVTHDEQPVARVDVELLPGLRRDNDLPAFAYGNSAEETVFQA